MLAMIFLNIPRCTQLLTVPLIPLICSISLSIIAIVAKLQRSPKETERCSCGRLDTISSLG